MIMEKRIKEYLILMVKVFIVACVVVCVAFLMCGCRTVGESVTDVGNHQELTERMDSMMRQTSEWQKEFLMRQTSIIESMKERERNDSSYSVTVNEKGDTVRERIVIVREVEKDHSMEREQYDVLMSQYNRIDSMLRVASEKQARTDSVLQEREKVIEKQVSLRERFREGFGFVFAVIMLTFLVIYTLRMKKD